MYKLHVPGVIRRRCSISSFIFINVSHCRRPDSEPMAANRWAENVAPDDAGQCCQTGLTNKGVRTIIAQAHPTGAQAQCTWPPWNQRSALQRNVMLFYAQPNLTRKTPSNLRTLKTQAVRTT